MLGVAVSSKSSNQHRVQLGDTSRPVRESRITRVFYHLRLGDPPFCDMNEPDLIGRIGKVLIMKQNE